MAIEGPLRELGIHDVFQLLDLSRKTGRLSVTSSLRDNEGTVYFRDGRVVAARIRSNPHLIGQVLLRAGKISEAELARARALQEQPDERRRLGDILVDIGAVTQRELERQVRRQIEAVVFELMSWQEGFFSFSEGDISGATHVDASGLSTESLLMEAARRIDEWTRIAHLVPSVSVVPMLADVEADHAPMLDLQPNEWEVLAAIDGTTDLHGIAGTIGASDFDVARIVYGLVSTGIVRLREAPASGPERAHADAVMLVSDSRQALAEDRPVDALSAAERALAAAPDLADAHVVAAQALTLLERIADAEAHLDRAITATAPSLDALMARSRLALRVGDLVRAASCWERVLTLAPQSPEADRAREALAQAARLNALVGVAGVASDA
jgi:hypothetical protein